MKRIIFGEAKGFTLVEVLIVIAIVGILGAVAYPSYIGFVVESNRTEAQRELMRLANLQEQFFIDSRTYTADMTALGMSADPYITDSGEYSIDAVANASTFTLTATAVTGGVQATKDTGCLTLSISETGAKTASGADCWEG